MVPFLRFPPPLCVIPGMLQNIPQGQGKRCCGTSGLAKPSLVCSSSKNVSKEACNLLCLPQLPEEKHRLVKLRLIICEISRVESESQDFGTQLFQLWAPRGSWTQKRHASYIQRWCRYVHRRHTDPVSPTVAEPLNFWRHFWIQDWAITPYVLLGQLCHLTLCSRMGFLLVSKNW